jgi:threonine dehydrogenase-like Zn-dependent dehydrogenase
MATTTRPASMEGVVLPGDRQVERVTRAVPEPGHRQVLLRVRASSICGSDIRAIYREHLGHGPEAYQGVIAGHEPAGEVIAVGPGCRRLRVGDRVAVYHIAGCGMCRPCQAGYMIGCMDPSRAAYGWQRDGGHAPFLLAEEVTCLPLPPGVSFVDAASAACSAGTAYEALVRASVNGRDRLLITGLGPVGLAVGMLARGFGVDHIVATDPAPERRELAERLGVVDEALPGDADLDDVLEATEGPVDVAIDASGNADARRLGIEALGVFGRCVLVGEGGTLALEPSPMLIHKQATLIGSWVTSLGHMAELLDRLERWDLHPESLVTDRFHLGEAAAAYELADHGTAGKVCIVMD